MRSILHSKGPRDPGGVGMEIVFQSVVEEKRGKKVETLVGLTAYPLVQNYQKNVLHAFVGRINKLRWS